MDAALQSLWAALHANSRLHDFVCEAAFGHVLSVVVFAAVCLPYTVLDLDVIVGYSRRRARASALQWATVRNVLVLLLWNQVFYAVPAALVHEWIAGKRTALPVEAPTAFRLVTEVVSCFLVYDLLYYIWHTLAHRVNFIFEWIHCTHHFYPRPFCWVALHVHPVEMAVLAVLGWLPAGVLCVHPLSLWAWFALWQFLLVDAHSGYDFPWQPHNLLPGLYNGSRHHAVHFEHPDKNYSAFLSIWDRIMGTYMAGEGYGTEGPEQRGTSEASRYNSQYLFHTFFFADICVRWFDIEYQSHAYALLYSTQPPRLHVISFSAFIISFFAATAAIDFEKNQLLLVLCMLLCSVFYRPVRLKAAVVGTLLTAWLCGNAIVYICGPNLVRDTYPLVVITSTIMGMFGNLTDVAFLGLYFDHEGRKFVAPADSSEAKLTKILPHLAVRWPFAVLQAFLAPFRLLPVIIHLNYFANKQAITEAINKNVTEGLSSAKHFRHVFNDPFAKVSETFERLGLPGADLFRSPVVQALVAVFSHGIPALVQFWLLSNMSYSIF
eukprot:m.575798 g.575798  ORF g.575798 m.575798 type:complete len:549 (+) comp57894_c1_seq1:58-1704(+)